MSETPNMSDADLPNPPEGPENEGLGFEDAAASDNELVRALADSEDRYLRLAAEYDNYRRRTTKEKTEAFDRGASSLAERLLDILDDIDRLAASDPATTSGDAFRSAFELIQKKVRKDLEASGLERIEPAGEPFDPTMHDAVAVVAPDTPEQDHTVKQTFQTGYRFKGTVIRPARVQVYSEQGVA
ncbi:MAG: nucleotide exchange factor GrpE [Gemmatimonadales bacterium]